MSDIQTAVYFSTIAEVKNVIFNLKLDINDVEKCYWEIKDQILYDYENIQNVITQMKVNRYNKIKLENKMLVFNQLKQQNEYYDDVLIQSNIDNTNIQQSVINVAYKKQNENKDIENMVKKVCDEKRIYQEKAVEFLQTYNFFYYDNKHVLTPDIIMSSSLYQTYLKQLYDEIHKLSNFIVNYKMTSDPYTKIINNAASFSYYNEYYVSTRTDEIKNKHDMLEHLVRHLYTLLKTIKNTDLFLNAIISSFVTQQQFVNFNNKFNECLIKFRKQRLEHKQLLPNSWSDYFKKWFIIDRINGINESTIVGTVKDYLRYTSFTFELNKIQNNYDKFIYKLGLDEVEQVDYVAFLFGQLASN